MSANLKQFVTEYSRKERLENVDYNIPRNIEELRGLLCTIHMAVSGLEETRPIYKYEKKSEKGEGQIQRFAVLFNNARVVATLLDILNSQLEIPTVDLSLDSIIKVHHDNADYCKVADIHEVLKDPGYILAGFIKKDSLEFSIFTHTFILFGLPHSYIAEHLDSETVFTNLPLFGRIEIAKNLWTVVQTSPIYPILITPQRFFKYKYDRNFELVDIRVYRILGKIGTGNIEEELTA